LQPNSSKPDWVLDLRLSELKSSVRTATKELSLTPHNSNCCESVSDENQEMIILLRVFIILNEKPPFASPNRRTLTKALRNAL
tara:strand:- start:206 stop:454 length:249 start_codon:yes stop_codon:yes gene_type:complete